MIHSAVGRAKALTARVGLALAAIMVVAVGLRLWGIRFGLPALYDPDEPIFVITGLKLLRDHTLNPGWFGHPGTQTIYVLAIIEAAVFGIAMASGRFADQHAFGRAVYTDPGIILLPGRLFIVACGAVCVALTFVIARRLFGDRVALTAAGLLAINSLHIAFSQIIRTDVHATVFMLGCVYGATRIARDGRLRDYLLAAACVGFAAATKWPAAICAASIAGAAVLRCVTHHGERARQVTQLAIAAVASVAALFVASPYIFLDMPTVLADLGGEAQAQHLGATGGGFLWNMGWYLLHPILESVGVAGLAAAAIGGVVVAMRSRVGAATILSVVVLFLVGISAQSLVWSRWAVPLMPFVAILMGVGFWAVVDRVRAHARPVVAAFAIGLAACMLVVPMLATDRAQALERVTDTRGQASAWLKRHAGPGSTILVEYIAADLLTQDWSFRFPAGLAGCIDGAAALRGQVKLSTLGGWRAGRSIVDLGTIDPARLDTCRSDYAMFTDYDRYRAERHDFAGELAVYERMLRSGREVARFVPRDGAVGGPVVRIVKLNPRRGFVP